jgi:hypothetical protein
VQIGSRKLEMGFLITTRKNNIRKGNGALPGHLVKEPNAVFPHLKG